MENSRGSSQKMAQKETRRLRLRVKPGIGLLAKITTTLSNHHIAIIRLNYTPNTHKDHILDIDISILPHRIHRVESEIRKISNVQNLNLYRPEER